MPWTRKIWPFFLKSRRDTIDISIQIENERRAALLDVTSASIIQNSQLQQAIKSIETELIEDSIINVNKSSRKKASGKIILINSREDNTLL